MFIIQINLTIKQTELLIVDGTQSNPELVKLLDETIGEWLDY